MTEWASLVEPGRRIIEASRLAGDNDAGGAEKFTLGDLLVDAGDLDDESLDALAKEIGCGVTRNSLKSYREVSKAWPPNQRVAASWTTHRTLMKLENRFDLIKAGMTLRQAQVAAGKRPADMKHPSRWSFDERVEYLITQLQDDAINAAVRDHVEQRKHARSVRAAARAVEEERSAEYREALRELREKNNAKHPERAVYEAIFKLRDAREYVRAVGKASTDEHSFVPEHRKPDVVVAVRDLTLSAVEALAALGMNNPSLSMDALMTVANHLRTLYRAEVKSNFNGVVIDAEPVGGGTNPMV